MPPQLLLPGLAVLSLLPIYQHDVGSLLSDEALLTSFAVVGVAAGLWVLERRPQHLAVYALFGSAMALAKNEGFAYVVAIGILLALLGLRSGTEPRRLVLLGVPIAAMLPWKLWMHLHHIPPDPYYSFSNLLRPGYLSDRSGRLWHTLHLLPAYYTSFDRWLLTLPVPAVLLLLLARPRPWLTSFVAGTVLIGFLGNVVVYWISPSPLDWYIAASADRTSTSDLRRGPAAASRCRSSLASTGARLRAGSRPGGDRLISIPDYDAAVPEDGFVAPPGQDESMRRMAGADNYSAWLLARGEPFLGHRILDLGAGIGTFTQLLRNRGEVVALEPDPGFVPFLRQRFAAVPEVTVVEGDAFSPELDGPFDTIICLNVLEHIADDGATLRRLHELLGDGGHLLLLVPAHPALFGEIDVSVGHERRYTRGGLGRRLEGAGFVARELRYVNPLGALGWLVSSKLLRKRQVPEGPLQLYDALVPVLRRLDRLPLPFGLSVWAVARKP